MSGYYIRCRRYSDKYAWFASSPNTGRVLLHSCKVRSFARSLNSRCPFLRFTVCPWYTSQDKTTCGPCRLKRLIREKILSTNASPHPCDQFQTNSNRVFLEELVTLLGGRWVASSLPYLLMHYVPPRLQGPCSHESSPLRLPCPRGWVTCLV